MQPPQRRFFFVFERLHKIAANFGSTAFCCQKNYFFEFETGVLMCSILSAALQSCTVPGKNLSLVGHPHTAEVRLAAVSLLRL